MPQKKVKSAKSARAASSSPKRQGSKKRSKSAVESRNTQVDILSPAAIINAYYICHNVADCLDARGFPWEGAKKTKKKKKKKKS
ncbi:unnamed protein product [Didymodactylos carnosus]|uniref:Small lysine-rich protein 1 n=1 Tax=Didymodactylos carnosus TaxID=1234261 RepID=A0A813Q512_9BILA|nr:unnamed protein product [Didymodactylos carnosus]CAF0938898.1 unnamed protein product [Didymodactylos carnosus]CAF3543098.1 unnamed protein product [Didymodactylos carnosus]CAF3714295.1 unnamed protein product [Didymodactylos carnosus]